MELGRASNSPAEHSSEVQPRETGLIEGPNECPPPPLLETLESPLEERSPRDSAPLALLRFAHARLAVPGTTPPAWTEGQQETALWNSCFL